MGKPRASSELRNPEKQREAETQAGRGPERALHLLRQLPVAARLSASLRGASPHPPACPCHSSPDWVFSRPPGGRWEPRFRKDVFWGMDQAWTAGLLPGLPADLGLKCRESRISVPPTTTRHRRPCQPPPGPGTGELRSEVFLATGADSPQEPQMPVGQNRQLGQAPECPAGLRCPSSVWAPPAWS